MAHPTARIFNVALPTGDEMDMAVEDCLPCSATSIHTDVERDHSRVLSHYLLSQLLDQRIAGEHFGLSQPKVVSDVALGDDQCVKQGDRKPVSDRVHQLILRDYAVLGDGAEEAGFFVHVQMLIHDRIWWCRH